MYAISEERSSLLHRINPLAKLSIIVPLFVFITFTVNIWTPLAFCLLAAFVTIIFGGISPLRFLRIVLPIILLMGGFVLFYPLLVRRELVIDSPLLFSWGPVQVYQRSIELGLATSVRLCALILLTLPFSLTTDATDFIRSLVQQAHVPYKFGYGALAAFRFVPMLQSEWKTIQAAHRIRGIADGGGLRSHYDRLRRYMIPLLATAIRRAERTALAMDGRAFGVFPQRAYYKRLKMQRHDYVFMILAWVVSISLIILLWQFGFLGEFGFLRRT